MLDREDAADKKQDEPEHISAPIESLTTIVRSRITRRRLKAFWSSQRAVTAFESNARCLSVSMNGALLDHIEKGLHDSSALPGLRPAPFLAPPLIVLDEGIACWNT